MTVSIIQGDALAVLRTLPSDHFHCVVTSPPYWGLRDYGVDGQIGLEETPDEWCTRLVEVFREVRRVLRLDGVCFVNIGDSYATTSGRRTDADLDGELARELARGPRAHANARYPSRRAGADRCAHSAVAGLKPKDLVGQPWMLAFALRADGWVLRGDYIWAKKNCMPESCRDRCTKSHEYVLHLTKARWTGPEYLQLSESDARWIALFLDTEGNIVIKRVQRENDRLWYGPQIAVANTCRALVERAREITGLGTILERPGQNAPVYYWQLSNRQAASVLRAVYNHLIVKRRQARIAIYVQSLLRHRGGQKAERKGRTDAENALLEQLWMDCKECNNFGNPDLGYVPEPLRGRWVPERYFWDAEAVRENVTGNAHARGNGVNPKCLENEPGLGVKQNSSFSGAVNELVTSRNLRSVWTIATEPLPSIIVDGEKLDHFASFPLELARRAILAGTSAKGCCPECGAPWARTVEQVGRIQTGGTTLRTKALSIGHANGAQSMCKDGSVGVYETTGWSPTCSCAPADPIPCRVLDPFGGSGRTALAAEELGRDCTLIELSEKSCTMAKAQLERAKARRMIGDAERVPVLEGQLVLGL